MADTSDTRTPAQIEADIRRRRDVLAETLDEIGVRVHPKTIVGDAKAKVVSNVNHTLGRAYVQVNRMVSDVRAQFVDEDGSPRMARVLPVALVAVGVVGLLALGPPAPQALTHRRTYAPDAGRFKDVSANRNDQSTHADKLPIRMLHDRVLVRQDTSEGERRSGGGILIPATAAVGRRLAWAEVVAVGQNVRTVEPGDRVLYDPEDRAEVEVRGIAYVLMRERDLHAVAADRFEGSEDSTGLYL
ncbi:hypothetical protein GCM10020295_51820 [Streptomyces cinereospinus]